MYVTAYKSKIDTCLEEKNLGKFDINKSTYFPLFMFNIDSDNEEP